MRLVAKGQNLWGAVGVRLLVLLPGGLTPLGSGGFVITLIVLLVFVAIPCADAVQEAALCIAERFDSFGMDLLQ